MAVENRTEIARKQVKSESNTQNIENVWSLTEQQKALWLYCVQSKQLKTSPLDPGVVQTQVRLKGDVNVDTLHSAWQSTTERFEMLRSSINLSPAGEPLIVCRRETNVNFQHHELNLSLQNVNEPQKNGSLAQVVTEEKQQGLDLSKPPACRLTLISIAPGESLLLWSSHHLLIDGWSALVVLNTLFTVYHSQQRNEPCILENSLKYEKYRKWLGKRNSIKQEQYWKKTLSGLQKPTLIADASITSGLADHHSVKRVFLSAEQLQKLREICRSTGITTATLFQAVWSCVLGAICNTQDVVIGIALSGRSADVEGISSTVGYLSEFVPLRISNYKEMPLSQWLFDIQNAQFEAQQHSSISISQILRCAEPQCQNRLFDSLLVIENLPAIQQSDNASFSVSDFQSDIVSGFPLTVSLIPADKYLIRCDFDSRKLTENWVLDVMDAYSKIVINVIDGSVKSPDRLLHLACLSIPNITSQVVQQSNPDANPTVTPPEMPSNILEMELLATWEEILQIQPLGMNSDFFAIGGTSLTALKLISSIEKRFDKRIPLSKILDHSTPALMLQLLTDENSNFSRIPCVFPLQNSGKHPGLFCVHAAGGHALMYREFSSKLTSSIPVYGVQPRGIDGLDPPFTTITEMAVYYVDEILKVQPAGPYHLLFYCFGGALMMEMASVLMQRGKRIGHLIAADAPAPIPKSHLLSKQGWSAYLAYEGLVKGQWGYLWHSGKAFIRRKITDHRRVSTIISETEKEKATPKHLELVQTACSSAFKSYRTKRVNVHVHILSSYDKSKQYNQFLINHNWDKITSGSTHYPIDSTHSGLFVEPSVNDTARIVSDILKSPCSDEQTSH